MVSLQAWIHEKLTSSHPPIQLMKFLSFQNTTSALLLSKRRMAELCSISDMIVFSYFVDDHDKTGRKNWLRASGGRYVNIDSGLGWKHGPLGGQSCLSELICSYASWWIQRDHGQAAADVPHTCDPICRFSRSTIQTLRSIATTEGLGFRLDQSLRQDALYPIFHLAMYKDKANLDSSTRRYSFLPRNFLEGLDVKLSLFLKYVEGCIQQHSSEEVLLGPRAHS